MKIHRVCAVCGAHCECEERRKMDMSGVPRTFGGYKPEELVSMCGVPHISREYKPEELVSMRGVLRIFGIFRNAECY